MGRFLSFALTSIITLCAVSFFSVGPSEVRAAPNLPPRPTLTPTVENLARILLVAGPAYEGAWTVVQWQDKPGKWHDVEGWQGHVRNGWIRWRVAPKDWQTGPFRWLLYDQAGGTLLASTPSFTLPNGPFGIVGVAPTAVQPSTGAAGTD
ncbi:MAG: hypothetical protein WBO46_18450 [Caldilineaceae bacterium]